MLLFSQQLNLQTKLNPRKAPLLLCKTGSLCVSAKTERCAPVTRFAAWQILAFCSIELIPMIRLMQNAHSAVLAPLYTIFKQAALVHQLSSFAQRAKLAGFADSAHSVDKAQSQTRLSSFAQAKLAAVR